MSLEQFCWNVMCGAIGGILAFLVFKFLENKGVREKIKESRAGRNDRNNSAEKRPQENDLRPEKRPQEHEERLR